MPLAVEFQPPSLTGIVDSAMLKRVVESVYPERSRGEICVFGQDDEKFLQISLFFPGEAPIHLELRPAWVDSAGFEAVVRDRIASATPTEWTLPPAPESPGHRR
jgi:hypothetical protein